MSFHVEILSKRVWKLVESDPYGQYPFIYVIRGIDKIVLIDTGTGRPSNLKQFVDTNFNTQKLPYLLALTHVHFDHVGGVSHFLNQPDLLGICMGSRNQKFSQNIEINSLAAAHPGCSCKGFEVTNWLKEGDLIFLDDNDKRKEKALEVVFSPGHTPDSIAFYFRFGERRLFVGDHLYPFTVIHLDCIGSNCSEFVSSLDHLIEFVQNVKNEPNVVDDIPLPEEGNKDESANAIQNAPDAASSATSPYSTGVSEFMSVLGLTNDMISNKFDVEKLMEFCDGSVESAINFYLTSGDQLEAICPPQKQQQRTTKIESPFQKKYSESSEVMLSCGHVEANLQSSALQEMKNVMELIKSGTVLPSQVDGNYAEYSVQNYTIMLPNNSKW